MPSAIDRYELEVPTTSDPADQMRWGSIRRALDAVGQRTAQLGTMPYAPSTPASWAAPAPTTVAAALDRLAAEVAVLSGAPVP